jgi:hypothetical protein
MEIKTVNWQRPDGVVHVRIMQKECSKCHKVKEVGMFRRKTNATDGRVSECIECERKRGEEIRARKRETRNPFI